VNNCTGDPLSYNSWPLCLEVRDITPDLLVFDLLLFSPDFCFNWLTVCIIGKFNRKSGIKAGLI
jgi:hypothetical protein